MEYRYKVLIDSNEFQQRVLDAITTEEVDKIVLDFDFPESQQIPFLR